MHPVLIIFCFLAGGVVLGIPGVILAVPVALVVKSTLATVYGDDAQIAQRSARRVGSQSWRKFGYIVHARRQPFAGGEFVSRARRGGPLDGGVGFRTTKAAGAVQPSMAG